MNPFSQSGDPFRTQADSRFNSFSEPQNAVNQNSGNWGINANYLTPSYAAGYRPQYTGPQGYSGGMNHPTTAQSANYIFNPLASNPRFGPNAAIHDQAYYNAFFRPMDRAADITQRFALPAVIGLTTYKYLDPAFSKMGGNIGAGVARGLMGGEGAATALGMTFGRGVGSIFLGGAMSAGVTGLAIGAVNKTMFDPYIAQRATATGLNQNFAGIAFGGGYGNQVTGSGLSRGVSADIARSVSITAARDNTFNQKEYSQIASMAARTGMMDNVNPDQMAQRIKSMAKQLKIVMSVMGSPDMQESMEIMAKLMQSGVGANNLAGAATAIGSYAKQAGVSSIRLLNTVANQGGYLAQANGMTASAGMMTASSSYASAMSMYRAGLISQAQFARMGGGEGMAQSATAGQIGMMQSPYATMLGNNRFFGGGAGGGAVENMSRFAGNVAQDPLRAIGGIDMTRGALASKMLQGGQETSMRMIRDVANMMPKGMAYNANGQLDSRAVYAIATRQFGMTSDQALAMLEEQRGLQDPKVRAQRLAGIDSAQRISDLDFRRDQGLNKAGFTTTYKALMNVGQDVQAGSASAIGEATGGWSKMIDRLENWTTNLVYGTGKENSAINISAGGKDVKQFNLNGSDISATAHSDRSSQLQKLNRHTDALQKINSAAATNPTAAAFINESDPEKRQALLMKLGGVIGSEYTKNPELAKSLVETANLLSIKTSNNPGSSKIYHDRMSEYAKISGLSGLNISELAETINDAETVIDNGIAGKILDPNVEARLRSRLGPEGASMSGQDLYQRAGNMVKAAQGTGTQNSGDYLKKGNLNSTDISNDFKTMQSDALKKKYGVTGKTFSEFINNLRIKTGSGRAVDERIDLKKLKYVDAEDIERNIKRSEEYNSQRSMINKAIQGGQIDFKTGQEMMNTLDNADTTGVFSDAVTTFKDAVEIFSGKKVMAAPTPGNNWGSTRGLGTGRTR